MIDYEYVEYCLKGYSKKNSGHHMRRYIKMIKYFEQNPPQDHQIKQNHHIVPKHMGGCEKKVNKIITAEWVAKSQRRIFNESHIGKPPPKNWDGVYTKRRRNGGNVVVVVVVIIFYES